MHDRPTAPAAKDRVFRRPLPSSPSPFHEAPTPVASAFALVGLIGLCLLAGAAGGAVTSANLAGWFHTLHSPPGTPPDAVFAPIWTVLYVGMGLAAWLVWRRTGGGTALRLWGWQLAVNALWPPAFFGVHSPALGLAVLAVLIALVALTIRAFARVHRLATGLLLPYLGWCCYAAYLNTGFWWLNPG